MLEVPEESSSPLIHIGAVKGPVSWTEQLLFSQLLWCDTDGIGLLRPHFIISKSSFNMHISITSALPEKLG